MQLARANGKLTTEPSQRTNVNERENPQEPPTADAAQPSRSRRQSVLGHENKRGEGISGKEPIALFGGAVGELLTL
jgi:hypothetical protein